MARAKDVTVVVKVIEPLISPYTYQLGAVLHPTAWGNFILGKVFVSN